MCKKEKIQKIKKSSIRLSESGASKARPVDPKAENPFVTKDSKEDKK